jgi:hypothetical protein
MSGILPTEHQIQAAFVTWTRHAEARFPALKLAFAVPNAAKRHAGAAAILKAEGMRPGVPDWWLPYPFRKVAGLVIEFKRPKTGKLSKLQLEYIHRLEEVGWQVDICTDWQEARAIVIDYLGG